ncbi:MAG: gliding motility-associated C-terminal domain-containing protein [Chitinophagales bacterium]|nr:gliding motility-associated C-terminal domain-containing protein [Chitinophagales bacterium]
MNWSKYLQHLMVLFIVIQVIPFSAKAEVFFRENKGQVKDQNWQPRPDVLYSYDEGDLHVHLKKDGLHYQLFKVLSWKTEDEFGSKRKMIDSLGIYRIDVQWLNTNKNVSIERGNALSGYENFYNVPDGIEPALLVKRYENLVYKNIYNGIDLHFFEGQHGGLEYDYIVQPGASYQDIQWQVKGASLSVNAQKELVLKTPYGDVVEGSLLVLQGDQKIDAEWQLEGNAVSIRITGNYDKTQPLRIDPPVRLWGTYYAGTGLDALLSCVEDAAGNVYTAGDASANNMATSGAHQTVFAAGSADGLLAKFNTNGQRIWATYYGGSLVDRGKSCGVDASGNVYLMGVTQSDNAIASAGAYQATRGGLTDVFIAKFNNSGVRQWGTYYGGTNNDDGKSAVVDATGNIYVCGNASYTSAAIASAGAHQVGFAGGLGQDCFLAKFSTTGQRVWGTYYGGNADDRPGGCAVDAQGNVYLCGVTSSGNAIATAGTHQNVLNNQGDAFIVKFNSNGVRQWGTYYGGTLEDRGISCGADGNGNAYLLGRTNSTSLIATVGTHQSNFAGDYDAFVVKLNGANGQRLWSTYYGGTGNEEPEFLHTNAAGDVLVSGETVSPTLIATTTAHQTVYAGNSDAFLALFNTNGLRTWGTYYGGANFDEGRACHIGGSGFYYMCGLAQSPTGIGTPGTYQPTGSGSGFLAKFEACVPPAAPTANGTTICGGQTATLTATAPSGVTFNWYAASTGGTALGTGTNFTTPTLNATTTYYVEAVATGCPPSTRTAVTVTVTPAPAAPIANTLTPGVCKDSVATFQVTSAGTTFNWYATQTSTTILGTGTTYTSPPLTVNASYFVERVENGCPSQRTQVFVQVITAPDPTPANTQICAGTTANINSNISNAFTVNWYDAPSATTPIFTGSIFTTPTLNSNTTYYAQTFVNGCPSVRVPVTVTVVTPPASPTVSGTTICAGQTATLNATAPSGVSFAWFTAATGGTAVFTGNPFTTPVLNNNTIYYVEAQAGSCVSSRTAVTVTVTPIPTAPIASTLTPGVCKDSVATFQVTSAGTTFNWYATATSTTILGTGTTFTSPPLTASTSYFVERVENGCPSQRTQVFVQVITAPDPTPANTQICAGTTANINSNISNAFTVNWYDAPSATTPIFTGSIFTTPTLNSNTTYYAQTVVNGCPSARVPVTVTVVTPPTAPTVSDTTICAGQTATLNATAPSGVSFAWFTAATGGTAVFTGNPFTTPVLNNNITYYAEAQIGSCNSTSRTAVTITVNPAPVATASSNSPVCEGGDINLSANTTAGATYVWSGPNGFTSAQQNPSLNTVSLNSAGSYSVTVTANGCSSTSAVNVIVNPLPVVNTSYNAPLCEGSDLNLAVSATANATYIWSGPNGYSSAQQNPTITSVQLSQAGSYNVTVTSAQGCSATGSVNVIVNALVNLNVTAAATPSTLCAGQSSTLSATGATNFNWSNGLGTGATHNVSPTATTTYSVTATDAATGCSAVANTSVTVNPLPIVSINASQTTLCENGTVTLTANGAGNYTWNTQETTAIITVSPTATTSYTVTGTDANGCSSTATQSINVLNFTGPQFAFGNNITLCYGSNAPTLPITSTNGITGIWQPSFISNTQSDTYTFTPDGGQCAANYIVNVTVQELSIEAGPDTIVELATNVQLFADVVGSTTGNYQWSPVTNLNCSNCNNPKFFALRNTLFTVTYTDAQTGCSISTEVNIEVDYDPNTIYYVPNVFSPNGDGNNDFFEIYGQKIKEIDLKVFNRWGELVYTELSLSPKWDGYYQGELQPAGVYVYHVYVVFFNGRTVQNKGSLTLVR